MEYIDGKALDEVLGVDAMDRHIERERWRQTNHYHSLDVPEIGEIVSAL